MRTLPLAIALLAAACSGGAPREQAASPTRAKVTDRPATADLRFKALGTEPFWGVDDRGDTALYTTPENGDGTAFAVNRTVSGLAVTLAGELDGQDVQLVIVPAKCSDGMSDEVFAYSATLSLGGRKERGCARRK